MPIVVLEVFHVAPIPCRQKEQAGGDARSAGNQRLAKRAHVRLGKPGGRDDECLDIHDRKQGFRLVQVRSDETAKPAIDQVLLNLCLPLQPAFDNDHDWAVSQRKAAGSSWRRSVSVRSRLDGNLLNRRDRFIGSEEGRSDFWNDGWLFHGNWARRFRRRNLTERAGEHSQDRVDRRGGNETDVQKDHGQAEGPHSHEGADAKMDGHTDQEHDRAERGLQTRAQNVISQTIVTCVNRLTSHGYHASQVRSAD